MYMFGAGNVYLTPQVGAGVVATPQKVGTLQEVSFDISFESKELYGNKQFPVMVARGKGKISGKAKTGEFKGALILSLLSGATQATGRKVGASEVGVVPSPSGPYTISTAHSANFSEDLGVIDSATGLSLTHVASGPTTGQYSVTAGVYTFAAADAGHSVQINYAWTDASTGKTISYSNQLMGAQSIYTLGLYNTNPDGSLFGIKFKNVVIPKLALGFKSDDFTMPDLDLSAFAGTDDSILEAYTPE
jgi:hypothetical protein